MKKSRYTDEQIAFALKQAETGQLFHHNVRLEQKIATVPEMAILDINFGFLACGLFGEHVELSYFSVC